MKSAPSSVATKVSGLKVPSVAAYAVPTSTGAAAAGSVRGRAAISQMCRGLTSRMSLASLGSMSWLERAAALRPDTMAVEAPEGALTYAELLESAHSVRVTAQRVAIALPPSLDFVVALHACLLSGVSVVPVDLREPVWWQAGAGQVIEALENGGQVRGEGSSLVMHTSGTAGGPREGCLS